MIDNDIPQSPRIAALRQELETGNSSALDVFWREVAEKGAPLFEPGEGDAQQMLVTFLWRGDHETRNVVVIGGLAGWDDFKEQQMTRLSMDCWLCWRKISEVIQCVTKVEAGEMKRQGMSQHNHTCSHNI